MQKSATYFAVFEPCADGYGVYFPDLPGCTSLGEPFAAAMEGAKEALGLHLWGLTDDKEPIPAPTEPPFAEAGEGCVIAAVTVYPELYISSRSTRH
ncbi:MAG: type II toxin-antitoxin system HicB family antitoxin [Oscillospiraceae bacterium]|jgi:predicted RNase H-like HicB family nuclease|nr:type II toxin-antitoxin system HicB family antitoxin [Oscillospiraceae bacterium]